MIKYCRDCKYHHFSEMYECWQCWHDNCIHEGEERDDLQVACEKFEENESEKIKMSEEKKMAMDKLMSNLKEAESRANEEGWISDEIVENGLVIECSAK
jgi:hypothetical protein